MSGPIVQRWDKVASSFARQASAKLNSPTSRQRFTRRRAAIAASMASEGFTLLNASRAAAKLASLWRRPPVALPLGMVKSGKQLLEIMRGWNGDLEPHHAEKVRELLRVEVPPEEKESAKLTEMLREIQVNARDIPGFFPTPPKLVDLMIDCADIGPDVRNVLEPSAGIGSILDRLEERHPDVFTLGIERCHALADILELKGHSCTRADFLEMKCPLAEKFEIVLMNPPFENGQDARHVGHAYTEMLARGGRLVAIVSEGLFFRRDSTATLFRDFLEATSAWNMPLPEDAFNGPDAFVPTGVRTRLVVIDKPL